MKDKELIKEVVNAIHAGLVFARFSTSRDNVKFLVLRQICRALKANLELKIGASFDAETSEAIDAVTGMLELIGEIKDK